MQHKNKFTFSFCGTAAQIGTRLPHFEISKSRTIRHTQLVGLFWTSDPPVAEAATYAIHNKHNRQASMSSAGF
jgi:hypothetical protein